MYYTRAIQKTKFTMKIAILSQDALEQGEESILATVATFFKRCIIHYSTLINWADQSYLVLLIKASTIKKKL